MSYPADLPPIELDTVQIEQVVFNLLENALRYTPEGSPIEISIQRLDKSLQVKVADRGPGIPLAEREQIFTKFYRIAQHGHPQGPGLGLAICQGIIQAHDGQIWVETCEGGGAAFCFTLPLHEIAEDDIDEYVKGTCELLSDFRLAEPARCPTICTFWLKYFRSINLFALTLNIMLFCALTFRLWPPVLIAAAVAQCLLGLIRLSWTIQHQRMRPAPKKARFPDRSTPICSLAELQCFAERGGLDHFQAYEGRRAPQSYGEGGNLWEP